MVSLLPTLTPISSNFFSSFLYMAPFNLVPISSLCSSPAHLFLFSVSFSLFFLYWPLCCQIRSCLRAFALNFFSPLPRNLFPQVPTIVFSHLLDILVRLCLSILLLTLQSPALALLSYLLSPQHLSPSTFLCILLRWKLILFTAVSPCVGQFLGIVRNLVNTC